jgi:hypothetical protein
VIFARIETGVTAHPIGGAGAAREERLGASPMKGRGQLGGQLAASSGGAMGSTDPAGATVSGGAFRSPTEGNVNVGMGSSSQGANRAISLNTAQATILPVGINIRGKFSVTRRLALDRGLLRNGHEVRR